MAQCLACGGQCGNGCGASCTGGCETGCKDYCGACGQACGSGCSRDCSSGCRESCKGGCGVGCASTCTGSCTGTCTGSCTGCTGKCEDSCKGTCAKIASLQLGGDNEISWEYFSSGDPIDIKAEDWNNVATGFKNYIKQAEQSAFPKDEEVEIDSVSFEQPITAELYNQLFLTLNGYVPSPTQKELNKLIVYDENGKTVGAIKDKTIIRAEHFSIIGKIFNHWIVRLK